MNLMQIGELANHLPEDFQEKNDHIPWRLIIDQRHIIAHGYGTIKLDLLWGTVCEDIPVLHEQCLEILKHMKI